jgi:hypothetical protein
MVASTEVAEAYGRAAAGYREALSQVEGARTRVHPQSPEAAEVTALTVRLGAHRERLASLAIKAQLPPPWLDGGQPAPFADAALMLSRAEQTLAQAEEALTRVERRVSPPLLPAASPVARTVLVFAACSLVAWLVQCGLLMATGGNHVGAFAFSLCGMPIFAFAGAMGILQTVGQPQAGTRIAYPIKIGALICFLGMPLAWFLVVAGLFTLNR